MPVPQGTEGQVKNTRALQRREVPVLFSFCAWREAPLPGPGGPGPPCAPTPSSVSLCAPTPHPKCAQRLFAHLCFRLLGRAGEATRFDACTRGGERACPPTSLGLSPLCVVTSLPPLPLVVTTQAGGKNGASLSGLFGQLAGPGQATQQLVCETRMMTVMALHRVLRVPVAGLLCQGLCWPRAVLLEVTV